MLLLEREEKMDGSFSVKDVKVELLGEVMLYFCICFSVKCLYINIYVYTRYTSTKSQTHLKKIFIHD